ncbi:MAG: hypothetical protein PWQ61_3397 [Betaproteobacteria bacterium]|nr:hypothetical protein [Betaproteobacteria bacterium]
MTTVQDFFSTNEVTGALTPEQAAQLLELPHQGDTVDQTEQAAAPATAPAPDTSAAEPNTTTEAATDELSADNAVILAKDGKHTIPFDKLAEARESAQQAAAERDAAVRKAAELQALLDAAKQPAQEQKPAAAAVDLTALRKERLQALATGDDARALELDEQIDAERDRLADERANQRMAAKIEQDQAQAAANALQRVAAELKVQYPALDQSSPKYSPGAEAFVVAERDLLIAQGAKVDEALRQAVSKAAPVFGWSNGQPQPKPDVKSAAEAAAAAIANAKAPTPATLSDIPGGKPAGLTLEEQMAAKSGPEMLDVMQSMSKDQIVDFMNRII